MPKHCLISGSDAWALLDADLVQQTGHKLRVSIPDTAVISGGVLKAWLYSSSKSGVLQSVPRCQHSIAALLQKLKAPHLAYDAANPDGWVAVAHFSDGLSWLVDAAGLEQLLSEVYVGAVPDEAASNAAVAGSAPELQLLQAYVAPDKDERFVTTFSGVEGSTTTTQVRSYSQRYHGPASAQTAQAAALSVLHQAHAAAAAAAVTTSAFRHPGPESGQRGSCAGSTASLAAGLAPGEPAGSVRHSAAAGEVSSAAGDFLRGSGTTDGECCCSSGRGSCISQGLSVDVGRESACMALQCSPVQVLQLVAHASACETPRIGLTADGRNLAPGHVQDACAGLSTGPAGESWQCAEQAQDSMSSSEAGQHPSTGFDGKVCQHAGGASSVRCNSSGAGQSCDSSSSADRTCEGNSEVVQAALGRVAKAAAVAVQALISYLDKALGLRAQGLVAEFIQTVSTATQEQQLVLVGLPHLSLDQQLSQGDTATFTERWGQFLAGAGPPPAPAPAQHSNFGRTAGHPATIMQPIPAQPARVHAGGSSCNQLPAEAEPARYSSLGGSLIQQACTVFSPLLQPFLQQQAHKRAGNADGHICRQLQQQQQRGLCHSSSDGMQSMSRQQQLNRQFFPALLAGQQPGQQQQQSSRPRSPDLLFSGQFPGRPLSAPRSSALRPASQHSSRPATASPGRMRTGTLGGISTSGGGVGSRPGSAVSHRPGAGGNPVLHSAKGDSCRLWLQTPQRPSDSFTAQLAAQLEASKEQVQRYAEAADAASMTAHCALSEAAQQVSAVQQELLQLRDDAAAAGHERRQLQEQIGTLQRQRGQQGEAVHGLQQQLANLQEQLAQDRATLATMLRTHQERDQQLQEDLTAAQEQNAELRITTSQLSSRLDEEAEVVSALRAQLVEYKLLMGQMQLQAKKGRTLHTTNSSMFRSPNRPGSATPPGQLQLGAGSITGGAGMWGVQAMGAEGGGPCIMTRSGSLLSTQMQAAGTADGAGRAQPQHRISSSDWQPSSTGANRVLPGTATAGARSAAPAPGSSSRPDDCVAQSGAVQPSSAGCGSRCSSAPSSNRSTQEQCVATAAATGGSSGNQVLQVGSKCSGATHASASAPQRQQGQAAAFCSSSEGPVQSWTAVAASRPAGQQLAAANPFSTTAAAAVSRSACSQPASVNVSNSNRPPDCAAAGSAEPNSRQVVSKGTAPCLSARTAAKNGAAGPDEAAAAMVSTIATELGPLAAPAQQDPTMLIGDMMVDAMGFLDPSAQEQLAVISGLMRGVYGDLMEVYTYYALLGKQLVVADRLTLELPQFGKLAYDLHVPQDNITLSAVEDIFYLLSDRKPCQMLAAAGCGAPGRIVISKSSKSKPCGKGGKRSPSPAGAGRGSADGADRTEGGGRGGVPRGGGQGGSGSGSGEKGGGAASGGDGVRIVLPQELIVPEQFPEALVRLACVRYRYGAVNWEYDWEAPSDGEDQTNYYTDSGAGDWGAPSPRSARIREQQDSAAKKGPKVLKPEGAALLRPGSPSNTQRARGLSPTRPMPEQYQSPGEADDLAAVVRTFVQQEVLKYARRSKVNGSSLGIRRAKGKPPEFHSWQALPPLSVL